MFILRLSWEIYKVINPLVADSVRFRTAARDEIYIVDEIVEMGGRHLTPEKYLTLARRN